MEVSVCLTSTLAESFRKKFVIDELCWVWSVAAKTLFSFMDFSADEQEQRSSTLAKIILIKFTKFQLN